MTGVMKMNNSLQYTLLTRDFVEYILLSLNSDYRSYIKFNKKKSKLSNLLYLENFDCVISSIAYNTFIHGKQIVYFYEKDNKIILTLEKHVEEKLLGKTVIKFPKKIMNGWRRKRLLNKVGKMIYPTLSENENYDNYCRDSVFIMDLINDDFDKMTKKILSINTNRSKCTDVYILYRELQKRKSQTILINSIFDSINSSLHKLLPIVDKSDIVSFDCLSLEELDDIEQKLLSGSIQINEVTNLLYKR